VWFVVAAMRRREEDVRTDLRAAEVST
jgi:hypothetical protein